MWTTSGSRDFTLGLYSVAPATGGKQISLGRRTRKADAPIGARVSNADYYCLPHAPHKYTRKTAGLSVKGTKIVADAQILTQAIMS